MLFSCWLLMLGSRLLLFLLCSWRLLLTLGSRWLLLMLNSWLLLFLLLLPLIILLFLLLLLLIILLSLLLLLPLVILLSLLLLPLVILLLLLLQLLIILLSLLALRRASHRCRFLPSPLCGGGGFLFHLLEVLANYLLTRLETVLLAAKLLLLLNPWILVSRILPLVGGKRGGRRSRSSVPPVPSISTLFPVTAPVLTPAGRCIGLPSAKV